MTIPPSTHVRWLAPGALAVLLGLAWLAFGWRLEGRTSRAAEGSAALAQAHARAPERLSDVAPVAAIEEVAPRVAARSAPIGATLSIDQPAQRVPLAAAVSKLAVQLVGVDVAPGFAGFQGTVVEAQAWVASTRETTLHRAEADAQGRVSFGFDRAVHIDWVRTTPPFESGLAFACVEEHHDVALGETYEVQLALQPGASVSGRVETLAGAPVAGARVHFFLEEGSDDLESFNGGVLVVESAPDGSFRSPPLPPTDWGLGVDPAQWIQIDPLLGSSDEGRDMVTVEAGHDLDVGVLAVVAACPLDVRVLDAAGQPTAGANVWLEPLSFVDALRTDEGDEEGSSEDLFMGTRQPARTEPRVHVFGYGAMERVSDVRGEVRVSLVAGRWRIRAAPSIASDTDARHTAEIELDVPSAPITLRLPETLGAIAGVVVDEAGAPLSSVGAWLSCTTETGQSRSIVQSDDAGRFRFDGLPFAGTYELTLRERRSLWAHWPVEVSESGDVEPTRYVLRKGHTLDVVAVDPKGAPPNPGRLVLRDFRCTAGDLLPEEQRGLEELQRFRYPERFGGRGGERHWYVDSLPAGVATLAWVVTDAAAPPQAIQVRASLPSPPSPSGQAALVRVGSLDWQTFEVPIADDPVRLVVDLSGYVRAEPAAVAQVRGAVTDAETGRPVAEATVAFTWSQGSIRARTNEVGLYGVGLRPGTWKVRAMAPGYACTSEEEVEVGAGEQALDIALAPAVRDLSVALLDAAGEPLNGVDAAFLDSNEAAVTCRVRNASGARWSTQVGSADGTFMFDTVPRGGLTLAVQFDGVELDRLALNVLPSMSGSSVTLRAHRTLADMRQTYTDALGDVAEDD